MITFFCVKKLLYLKAVNPRVVQALSNKFLFCQQNKPRQNSKYEIYSLQSNYSAKIFCF